MNIHPLFIDVDFSGRSKGLILHCWGLHRSLTNFLPCILLGFPPKVLTHRSTTSTTTTPQRLTRKVPTKGCSFQFPPAILGHYLSLSSPHMGIQSSWLLPLHAWRNLCWLSRPVSLQLPQLALQDCSERPYLLEISHAESEAGAVFFNSSSSLWCLCGYVCSILWIQDDPSIPWEGI